MSINNKIEMIKNLTEELYQHNYNYYVLDKPTIDDSEYDKRFDELKTLEIETGFIMANSVTQKVGFEVKSKLTKVTHKTPLKSLGKTKDANDLIKFHKGKECLLELKNDGLTNEIIFNHGFLQEGSTRGDSITGELITHNVLTYKNLPKQISFKGLLRISGEAIIKYTEFERINNDLLEEDKYKTPRNLCAGSVRQLDSKICNARNINFLVFGVLEAEGMEFETKHERFLWLQNLGFEITPYIILDSKEINFDLLQDRIETLKQIATSESIPIDGEVITYNSIKYSDSLPETNHHPLHSLAFKFYDEEEITEYLYTDWNTTRTGMISCTGVFKPCILDNTSVERASLYNIDMFEELQLGKGDSVSVVKRNQIIPKIVNNSTRSNTETIPSHCPCCNGKTDIRIKEKTRFLYCTNDECGAKLSKIICHYCSKPAMNIDGVSTATIENFMDNGIIENMVDLYKLENKKSEILELSKFGVKKYNNLITAIENSKLTTTTRFLISLGIPNVGAGTAKDISNHFNNEWVNIWGAMIGNYDFTKIKDVGMTTHNSLHEWTDSEDNLILVIELLNYIKFEEEVKVEVKEGVSENKLFGTKIYATGVFTLKKAELKTKLAEIGCSFESGYKKSLDYLILGGDCSKSGKKLRAETDGVKLMTEEEMNTYLK